MSLIPVILQILSIEQALKDPGQLLKRDAGVKRIMIRTDDAIQLSGYSTVGIAQQIWVRARETIDLTAPTDGGFN